MHENLDLIYCLSKKKKKRLQASEIYLTGNKSLSGVFVDIKLRGLLARLPQSDPK